MTMLEQHAASAQQVVDDMKTVGSDLHGLLRKTSQDIREDRLHGQAIFDRSQTLDHLRNRYQRLVKTHADLRRQHHASLQTFDATVRGARGLREWEGVWSQRVLELARMGVLFERAGLDPYKMTGIDREQLFTLPGYEERQTLYRYLSRPFPEPKGESISSDQLSEVDGLLLKLTELPKAPEKKPPPEPPPKPPAPEPTPTVTGLHLAVCSYLVLGRALGHDVLYPLLEKLGLTHGIDQSAFRDAVREGVRRSLLEAGTGSPYRDGMPRVLRLSARGKTTAEGCSWLSQMPAGFAKKLEAGILERPSKKPP